jgi:hypothetical protein
MQWEFEFVRKSAMMPIDERFDIVVTSNSGYPIDLNLYQCIKGMGAASQNVKQGGAILMIAECSDGILEHGLYEQLMQEGGSPEGVLHLICQPGFPKLDQWSAKLQAQIQLKADVYIHSGQLTETSYSCGENSCRFGQEIWQESENLLTTCGTTNSALHSRIISQWQLKKFMGTTTYHEE